MAATGAASEPILTSPLVAPFGPTGTDPTSTKQTPVCPVEPAGQGVAECAVSDEYTAGKTGTNQNGSSSNKQQRPSPSLSQGAKPGPKQRTLGDFYGTLLPQADVCLSGQIAVSKELSTVPTASITLRSEQDLRQHPEVSPLVPIPDNRTRVVPAPPASATPSVSTSHPHPIQANADLVDMSRLIVLKPIALGATPWTPGTMNLYPLPRGTNPPGSPMWQHTLPLWKVRVEGLKPQQAMFQIADNLSPGAFYIAADDWTRKNGKEWGIGKRYGAFRSAVEFVTNFLEISQNRCFYEIIRKDRPCKAYLDLEADAGAMTERGGENMCDAVLREWKRRIINRWPMVVEQCAQCFGHMILKGSRMTGDGLKISYHIIFPWLVFPCNTTMLHDEVGSMSEMPQFQYNTARGERKSFIDPGVYTSNRQFRLLLCNKLSDRSRTALHLFNSPTIAMFVRSCITHIGGTAGVVPQEVIPRAVAGKSSARKTRKADGDGATKSAPATSNPLCHFLYQMLRRQGQPDGTLTLASESTSEIKFRWQVPSGLLRPCMTAQIWRPSQAGHKSNGAWVSVDRHGGVYLICLHPQCLQRGYCNKRLLGQTPLSLLNLCSPAREAQDQNSDGPQADPVIPQSELQRGNAMGVPRQKNQSEESRNPEGSPEDPHVSAHSHTTPQQPQSDGADELLVEASTAAPAERSQDQRHRKLSREQSLAQVAAENQHAKSESFQAWTVETGQWGGRVLGAPEAPNSTSNMLLGPKAPSAATLQDWVASSEASPFSVHPPDSLLNSVQSALMQDNARHAREHVQTRLGERSINTLHATPRNDAMADRGGEQGWSIGPAHAWLQAPIVSRPSIGRDLLDRATLSIRSGAVEDLNCPYRMDTWSSPFIVGYLNVGRRHLVGSLPAVVELVLRHRPDILFLGDLVTSRDHIGRLKKRLESDLHDEWFVTTNISALPGRPVGVGAIVHCSLANHITDCVVQYPDASGLLANQQEWNGAVDGRIQCIKVTRPGSPFTWKFVSVYQHVARSANRTARALVRNTLHDLVEKARKDGHRVAILGDFNAAPPGGRWGYSKWSAAAKEDQTMNDWVRTTNLTEVLQHEKPTPTWKPSEGPQEATLDRVLVTHDDLPLLELSVKWHHPLIVFDHALLILRIQHSLIGTGYAGACRPDREAFPKSRCRVNLKKWREHVSEWNRLVHAGLRVMSIEHQGNPPDPFEALKRGELLADSVAQALAPKYIRKPGDTRRAFGFAGNRLLFRELNLLRKARSIVYKVFSGDTAVLHCPHRLTRWILATRDLHLRVRRSGHAIPQPLERAAYSYFSPTAKSRLETWLESAKLAIASRQAAVRESYEKAQYHNLQNLRKKRKEANGVLDKRTIQAALGKCQPRQRMWGVSGKVILGVRIDVQVEQQLTMLEFLKGLQAAETIVHLSGDEQGLSIWFSGPRQAGDFVAHWSSVAYPGPSVPIQPLQPPGQYVAIRPDDMLSVQEWHMASEGMDTYSVCPNCQTKGLHVISTGAVQQQFGNPNRAVRFFCALCQSVCDKPAMAPMPPCPIPKQVLEAMRRIPAGTLPLINRTIDFETLERCARKQPNGKAPGEDGQPREYCKYGPTALLELYWQAINAYLRGETPSVCISEWIGAVAGYIPKKLSALLMTEFRPVACICTKFSLLLSIVDGRMDRTTEDYGLIDDTQEGFRRDRSTQRQLGKLRSIFAEQRRRKESLSVVLYLDIKNAFNAVNHRAIFYILEAKGFPEEDITLFRRMYTGSFLVMGNHFGRSAACVLNRGMPQGAQPSPRVFNTTFDPVHAVIRDCRRGCTLQGSIDPTGSSGFADDSSLHTDGPDAIPAMATLVPMAAGYMEWAGMEINLKKCGITAMDMKTGQRVATDSVTLHGEPFPVILPNQSHKHLGLRMALNGDFSAEKEHVCQEMRQRLEALAEDRVLSRKEKEVIIRTAVCSVFCYSAGLVNWTRTELDSISRLWARAYKQAWTFPGSMDSSPIILDQSDGGRGCPSATDLWTRAVLEVFEQCVSLPGEISRIVTHYLRQQCQVHGCYVLNQLQLLLRVSGKAESVLELFLLRMDEQGLEISSPWETDEEESIAATLWPRIYRAWLDKERWVGCREVVEEVRTEWDQAQLCLKACEKLGSAEPAILSMTQLRGRQTQWMHVEELKRRQCHFTPSEYAALTSWLPKTREKEAGVPAGTPAIAIAEACEAHRNSNGGDGQLRQQRHHGAAREAPIDVCSNTTLHLGSGGRGDEEMRCSPYNSNRVERTPPVVTCVQAMAREPSRCPPYIGGQILDTLPHGQLVLRCPTPDCLPEIDISSISDLLLMEHLCQGRAVFPYPRNDDDTLLVECLMPLRTVVTPYPFKQEYIVARLIADEDAPVTVMQMALVRDCLTGNGSERLQDACSRPCWTVASDEFYAGHSFTSSSESCTAPGWKLQAGDPTGQLELAGLVQYISKRRRCSVPRPAVVPHPWQTDPPLPSRVTIDVSHHYPKNLPAPEGWEIIQRNGRVWIAEYNNRIAKMDAAQYSMLLTTCCNQEAQGAPTTQFLAHISKSCRAQQDADQTYYVHWSRHLLASVRQITGTELLIGASAVTYNPHFLYFFPPSLSDVSLGAVDEWPQVPALLVLDSFAPQTRHQVLKKATTHHPGVWVLRQHKGNPDEPDLASLRRIARLYAELPKKSMVLHREGCWETAAWDVEPSRYVSQLWRLDTHPGTLQQGQELHPAAVQQHLDRRDCYAFHWSEGPVPPRLLLHRQHQQDALRHDWDGMVAGTDGSVDERTERMGAGYVLGADPVPIMTFCARVGGPLASARAEAASLLQLLRDVRQRYTHQVHLLIFVDCLVVLDILMKWGRSDFHPGPKEIVHFAVIRPLLHELRQWRGNVTLVKVKSHTGCLLNERADEQAELGRMAEEPEICPGPQKYGSFWLRVRPTTREFAEKCGKPLPRDSAPNRSLLEKVAISNTLRAVRKRSTLFVTDLLHRTEGATVSKVIRRCTPAEYRVWLRCMTGIYPVQIYLKRIGVVTSPTCPHCVEGIPESLTHFACVCPKFREARTSAHNQVRDVITSFLTSTLGSEWTVFEETRMAQTGLILRPTPQATIDQLGRRQPDWLLVSETHKKIAIVDLCRPSDVHPAQLLAAAMRKQHAYGPLEEALSYYADQGWVIHVFPWVVGIRGTIDPLHIESLLKFLGIQRKHWQVAVERTVLASVRAFHFLHKVRFGGLPEAGRPDLDPDHSDHASDEEVGEGGTKRKSNRRKAGAAKDCTDSDSSEGNNLMGEPHPPSRVRRTLTPRGATTVTAGGLSSAPSAKATTTKRTLSLPSRASATTRGSGRVRISKQRASKAGHAKAPTVTNAAYGAVPNTWGEHYSNCDRRQPKRRRCGRASTTSTFDTDDPDQRPTKQYRQAPDGQPEALWNRWRQMEPRRRWRT